jgi:hypothetical protein
MTRDDIRTMRELLTDCAYMLENIQRARELPPMAQAQAQYVALGRTIRTFLTNHKEQLDAATKE